MKQKLFAFALFALPAIVLAATTREVYVELSGPTLVGYFPAATDEQIDDEKSGVAEGINHLQLALLDVSQCLKKSGITVDVRSVFGGAFTLAEKGRTQRITLPTAENESVGMYLLEPGKEPRAVSAPAPAALITLAPEAAADFFHASACKPTTTE